MPDELSKRLGTRTVSRLVKICGDPIPLWGEDDRKPYPAKGARTSSTHTGRSEFSTEL
jgi:hypothetical protein